MAETTMFVLTCSFCKQPFECAYKHRRYCTVKCRGRNRRADPAYRKIEKARWQAWCAKNRAKLNAYSRSYYPAFAVRRHARQPWITILAGTKRRARIKNITFNLSAEWAAQRWTGFCELTGLPFSSPEERINGIGNRLFSPSIDRIHAQGPYSEENCRLVIWAINSLKGPGSDADMYKIAEALILHKAMASRKDSSNGQTGPSANKTTPSSHKAPS